MLDDEVVYFAFLTLGIFEIAPYQLLTKRDRRSPPPPIAAGDQFDCTLICRIENLFFLQLTIKTFPFQANCLMIFHIRSVTVVTLLSTEWWKNDWVSVNKIGHNSADGVESVGRSMV
ncbi:hypothetical protein T01_5321 [Trichinella spiralis]|uniref:Uncharacterized protein n=1 Tax=Trichinella spiralis TaxID=6334 RepID=A0A0V1B500_TRISP|nr:hypothetical protein T01_5321 [Trichinella spiralis]